MSLIEVVVAVVILALMSTAILGVILKTQTGEVGSRARVAAASLAAREIDLVREQFLRTDADPAAIATAGTVTNPHPLDGGLLGQPLTVDATAYTIVRSAAWKITGSGASACEGGDLVAYPMLGVTVVVTWPNMGSIKPVVSTAAFAPEKDQGISTAASFVAVKVLDAAGAPNPGRSVSVSSPSEAPTGLTDATGCAVVQVNPATGGTAYTVKMIDAGYVDIAGNANPTKTTGTLGQGALNHELSFSYDRAGTVRVRLVDPSGAALTDDDVWGASVTLVASEFSGASSSSTSVVTTVQTVIGGLWPGNYGAYYGTVPPASGFLTKKLAPGGSIDIDVAFTVASSALVGLPATTTSVVAVPAGGGCAAGRPVDPAGFSLLPGVWDFYATGPKFSCSPGPFDIDLAPGVNSDIPWGATTLQLTGVPAGGRLWAVERSKAPTSVTTCPAVSEGSAVDIDGARSGAVTIPAGDWYLFLTDGAAGGACVNFPAAINPAAVAYGAANVVGWPALSVNVTLQVTSVPTTDGASHPVVVASQTLIAVDGCTRTSFPTASTILLTPSGFPYVYGAIVQPGRWYIYAWDTGGGKRYTPWSPRCRFGGTMIGGVTSPLTLVFNSGSPDTVGP